VPNCPHCGVKTKLTSWGSTTCMSCRQKLVHTGEIKWEDNKHYCGTCGRQCETQSGECHSCWRARVGYD